MTAVYWGRFCFMKVFRLVLLLCGIAFPAPSFAQNVNDPSLAIETVVSGLDNPTTMAFLGVGNDFFILQKDNGKVMLVHNGTATEVLDMNVDNDSEHGMLGIA